MNDRFQLKKKKMNDRLKIICFFSFYGEIVKKNMGENKLKLKIN